MKSTVFFILICLMLSTSNKIFSQTIGTRTYDGSKINSADSICTEIKKIKFLGFKDHEDIYRMVKEIIAEVSLHTDFGVIRCNSIHNCYTYRDEDYQYLIYDPDFLRKFQSYKEQKLTRDKIDWSTFSILAHEVGHILNNHLFKKRPITNDEQKQMELEADEFSGRILSSFGATYDQAIMAVSKLKEGETNTHPSKSKRIQAIKKGWNKGEKTKVDNLYADLVEDAKLLSFLGNDKGFSDLINNNDEKDFKDPEFFYKLALKYEKGIGFKKNYKKAVEYYRKAIQGGNTNAMNNLGVKYAKGLGVVQNYDQAFSWYRKAAQQGNSQGMFNLAYLYETGNGTEQNYLEAVKWYEDSSKLNHAEAFTNLGVLYANGKGVEKDLTKALELYRKGAEYGNDTAFYNVGLFYEQGFVVAENISESIRWYIEAANLGYQDAFTKLEKFGIEIQTFEVNVWVSNNDDNLNPNYYQIPLEGEIDGKTNINLKQLLNRYPIDHLHNLELINIKSVRKLETVHQTLRNVVSSISIDKSLMGHNYIEIKFICGMDTEGCKAIQDQNLGVAYKFEITAYFKKNI